ncbi:hypothetical protein ABNX05_15030 [Lysinibacillus sp. M3]|uniref:Uncharacterized protein n=1 Tax=Lysinibacillus zambalensis TaxID=3160866 RepID=A0ABV1MTV6_9BACI
MSFSMDHFTAMEELGQITIFDVLDSKQPVFSVGDNVKTKITPNSDDESYNYFKEYYPEVLKKSGEIIEVRANNQYLVNFAGTNQILNGFEIERKK